MRSGAATSSRQHTEACMEAGLDISGTNAEVMIGPVGVPDRPGRTPSSVADQIWLARWLLYRTAEDYRHLGDHLMPKPVSRVTGTVPGMHTNFSTK
jgi:glutamine synthetase